MTDAVIHDRDGCCCCFIYIPGKNVIIIRGPCFARLGDTEFEGYTVERRTVEYELSFDFLTSRCVIRPVSSSDYVSRFRSPLSASAGTAAQRTAATMAAIMQTAIVFLFISSLPRHPFLGDGEH